MEEEGPSMYLTCKEISSEGRIPRQFTQDAQGAVNDISPPLEWHSVPEDTESLALILEDPDAPDPADPMPNPFVHWVVVNIPPTLKGLPAGFNSKDVEEKSEYAGIHEGHNDYKVPGYRGPNPPIGLHRYEFRLFALDTTLKVGRKATRDKVLEAMEGHILAETVLVGTYGKDNFKTGRQLHGAWGTSYTNKGTGNVMAQMHR